MLRNQGWKVNHKRVERIWRQEGLKVPSKQPKRSRLWLNDGSCVRLRPQYPDHVWSYDFMLERAHNGQAFRILSILPRVPGGACGETDTARGCTGTLDGAVLSAGRTGSSSFRQWTRVHGAEDPRVVAQSWSADPIHRAWQPLGEWLC